ncbi:MAG: hypothetical protein Q9161_001513 [Pseudevernia consocians]
MAFTTVFCLSLLAAFHASAQSACTTLQPVFELPFDGTSTVFRSTITSASSVDCGGCSLVVSTFRAVVETSVTTPTTTTTVAATTSASFICLPETSASTSSSTSSAGVVSIPTPTASPLPPVTPTVQEFIDELSTVILYAELFSNAGNQIKLCSVINPASLDEIRGIAINGSVVQQQVCALAAIEFATPDLGDAVIAENQAGVSYLATALFAVQVAGNYAGGPNLATLCSEIEAALIDALFIGYIPGVGTAVKDYVCSAASASATPSTAAPSATPPPYRNTTATTATPTCASPTGFANTVVPAPRALATANFQVAPAFTDAHTVFVITDTNVAVSEASIASFCLDECIAYKSNSTAGPCLSFNVNLGRPIPPTGNGGPEQWYCSGYDAYLADDGSDYVPVEVEGSYMFGLGVNRNTAADLYLTENFDGTPLCGPLFFPSSRVELAPGTTKNQKYLLYESSCTKRELRAEPRMTWNMIFAAGNMNIILMDPDLPGCLPDGVSSSEEYVRMQIGETLSVLNPARGRD